MIRLNKPVRLLEWGKGTSTQNQNWRMMAEGKILSCKRSGGTATMVVEIPGSLEKENQEDDTVKVAQLGEGMAPMARKWGEIKDRWGEVAMGRLKSMEGSGGKTVIAIEIAAATKVGRALI
jgi:hypothetical protein